MKRKLTASFALVAEAISAVAGNRAALLAAAFLPMAGIFLINTFATEITSSAWSQFSLLLFTLPLYALFATVVHRVVLLGEHSLPNRWGIFWTERETRFLGWLIGVWFLFFALSVPVAVLDLVFSNAEGDLDVAWIATILSYILVAYFQGRFSLVLPATAIDRRSSFRESWAMSRGKGMMIAMALVIPAMILIPVEWALYGAVGDTFKPIADIVWILLVLPVFAVEIAIISLAFDKLSS